MTQKSIFLGLLLAALVFFFGTSIAHAWIDSAPATWENALARMPLLGNVTELTRTNAVHAMLRSFASNSTVKALIFMPGATDEFYMFHRAKAVLTNASPSLLDAINALAAQSLIQATFTNSVLLLHTDEDPLDPIIENDPKELSRIVACRKFEPHAVFDDLDWNGIQPLLRKSLKADVRPWRRTPESWHFYRHSFAAWGLNGEEALCAVALAGKTTISITRPAWQFGRLRIVFEPDRRVLAVPKLTEFPR